VSNAETQVTIATDEIRVTVSPHVGGTITEIVHRSSGLSVLGRVPWDPVALPIASFAARDEPEWLTRYTGGWPLLFPNGGDACTVDGMFHGFHGEASISPWRWEASARHLRLARRFYTVPVEMERVLAVEGDTLVVSETLRMQGAKPIDVMWGHHPTFGSDLLDGPFEITAGGGTVTVDDAYDPEANPLRPGAAGRWPLVEGKSGPFDLGHPPQKMAALAYLHDLDASWLAIRRMDNAIAAQLSWDRRRFPCAWLWYELGGTEVPPWHGRGRLIGLEPNSTMPAYGLATAGTRGANLLRLHPGEEIATELRLHVFKPEGPVVNAR
jgi:hypothetical protein